MTGYRLKHSILAFMAFIVPAFVAGGAAIAWQATGQMGGQTVGASGNPLPRFVSMSASKANLRNGPGRQYPVAWVYLRHGLPLEIIDEHGAWRKVRDHEGTEGWMLVSLLYGRRTVMIRGKTRNLHHEPALNAPVAIIADPGVIGEIEQCEGLWCEVIIDGDSGWVERRHVWGVYATEEID